MADPTKDWPPPTLEAWCEGVDKEPGEAYLLDKLLPQGATVIMSGRPKLPKKTWMAMAMAQALTTGQPLASLVPTKPEGVSVLFCELEGPRHFVRRRWAGIEAAHKQARQKPLFFAHRIGLVLNDKGWQTRLAKFVAENNVGLVVIDTLTKASRGDENDSSSMGEVLRALEEIRRGAPQCTIMFLHHLSKRSGLADNAEDIDDEIRGSTAIAGGYDTHWALRVSKDDDSVLWLIVRSSNGVTRYYNVSWEIAEEGEPMAKLSMQLLCEGKPPTQLLTMASSKLEAGKVYKPARLAELWRLPADLAAKVRRVLCEGGQLSANERGSYKAL